MADKAKTITVKGKGDDRKVILWEKDAAHPRGEVMIANDGKVHEVAETAAVKRLIGEGRLVTATTQETPVSREQTPPTQTRKATEEEADPGTLRVGLTDAEAKTATVEQKPKR